MDINWQDTFILYIILSIIFVFIIIKHHSKKNSSLLVMENVNIQRSNIIYILCLFGELFLTLFFLNSLISSELLQSIVLGSSLLLVIPMLVAIALLIIFLGLKSILEKRSIVSTKLYKPTVFGRSPEAVTGIFATLVGFFYVFLGLILMSMIASALKATVCANINTITCSVTNIFSLPFELFGELTAKLK